MRIDPWPHLHSSFASTPVVEVCILRFPSMNLLKLEREFWDVLVFFGVLLYAVTCHEDNSEEVSGVLLSHLGFFQQGF